MSSIRRRVDCSLGDDRCRYMIAPPYKKVWWLDRCFTAVTPTTVSAISCDPDAGGWVSFLLFSSRCC